ncbi:TrmB family transcriptional regulator [Halolamina salifodinae]|uniref:Sugar-specific transcriptional regulator TrmB n=2 Tax=Halolamina salifodinae TaxID=1202767 RepID=A0A8T4GX04_9EURY|nr:TrmB family transcriptional regulator [Halolamina salifodinae]MBP1987651.1 sugar-specific transcriptional regulator TrmB [Halolamina salifodinae]
MANLRDLGLSEYEARAYRALLDDSPSTAKELSRSSDVPMGRVYDVLKDLEQRGLVRSQAASRPKKYVAVEPEAALDRLLEAKRDELAEQESQYESAVNELEADLEAGVPTEEGFWTAVVGPEESADLLIERLDTADERVIAVAGGPTPQFDVGEYGDEVAAAFQRALERGAEVSVLLGPDLISTLPATVLERYESELADHPGFEVRTTDRVTGSFHLIDGVEACIEVPNPLTPREPFAMLDLKDREFSADVRETFDPRWDEAELLTAGE